MDKANAEREQKVFWIFIILCQVVCLSGWAIPLMDIDAAQYANMSREMMLNKHYLEIYDLGKDYLDKPPMLFWLSSLSMRIFGINAIAYRLPSFLFSLIALFSTYKLASLYYNQRIAMISTLVLASCQAMILINHDVRTDTMLMGWVTFSLWQMASWYKTDRWKNLMLASIGIAGGLLTKGPIAFMVPVFAFLPHFLLQRNFKQFFRWQYLIMLLIIGILLIPMSIGLYRQFDLHPEKIMYGQTGISGLRFFYWTQSFGRITGESTWHENDSFFFLFQNMIWGFLPWILFFVIGIFDDIGNLIRRKFRIEITEEAISTGGFILTYCALASSRAQLPHYIYVVFPLAAIITGKFLYKLLYTSDYRKWVRPLLITQVIVLSILSLILFGLLVLPFPPFNPLVVFSALSVGLFLLWLIWKSIIPLPQLITISLLSVIFINFFLNIGFYPKVLDYQLSISASKWIREHSINKDRFYIYKEDEHESFHFYSNHSFVHVNNPDSLQTGDWMLTSSEGYQSLDSLQWRRAYRGEQFHVSTLSIGFLNPSTRKSKTKSFYILEKIKTGPALPEQDDPSE